MNLSEPQLLENQQYNGQTKKERRRINMQEKENESICYYDVCFSDGSESTEPCICIKGVRQPSVSEANEFLAKDVELYGAPVVSVDPIDEETARNFFDFSDEKNWPVFGV